jgi:hypothetical protein
VREVDAVPGTDLDHLTGQARRRRLAAFGHTAFVHRTGHLRIYPAEDQPPYVRHVIT